MSRRSVTAMRRAWDRFADDDPMFFIAANRTDWNLEEFLESGEPVVGEAMAWLGDRGGRERMLDIGCGLGRIAKHFGAHFDRVDGIDISARMVDQARNLDLGPNVQLHVAGGDRLDFDDEAFDLVYSSQVFQHVPDETILARYASEIERVLKANGAALLHFHTGREGVLHRLRQVVPDALLPRTQRRHMRRYARDPHRVRQLLRDAGLILEDERDAATSKHQLMLRKA